MHKSVLLNETIENLNIKEDSICIDCTLGYGGHSKEILKRIKRGWLFAFDQDVEAINHSKKELEIISKNFEIIKSNFVNLKEELKTRGIFEVDAILFDLGVSSPQLDNPERGFSYHSDSTLDMRMDKDNPISAETIVNEYSFEELTKIFFQYGEEKYSKSIAKKICKYREDKRIKSTLELVEIIKDSVPMKYKLETHPARRVFQAIRIEVNKELDVLEKAFEDAIDILSIKGRICIITFQSLEETLCKKIIKKYSEIDKVFKDLPEVPKEYMPKIKLIARIKPSENEILENNRSRSATLSVIEKI
jgi:16S rRNA (cytosine1402-N4)-methyltransferase